MKEGIHPDYHPVVFEDSTAGEQWLGRSTMTSGRTAVWEDGNEYPHILLDVSMYSHPFYTGTMKIVDSAGRVERFRRRYGDRNK